MASWLLVVVTLGTHLPRLNRKCRSCFVSGGCLYGLGCGEVGQNLGVIGVLGRQVQRRGEHAHLGAAVETATTEAEPGKAAVRCAPRDGVGQLDLATRAGLLRAEGVEDRRVEDVATDDRFSGWRVRSRGFFDHTIGNDDWP